MYFNHKSTINHANQIFANDKGFSIQVTCKKCLLRQVIFKLYYREDYDHCDSHPDAASAHLVRQQHYWLSGCFHCLLIMVRQQRSAASMPGFQVTSHSHIRAYQSLRHCCIIVPLYTLLSSLHSLSTHTNGKKYVRLSVCGL